MFLSPSDGPIDLKMLGSLLSTQLIELGYASPPLFGPTGPSPAVRDAIEHVRLVVESDGYTNEARRALAWLLNLPDKRLIDTTVELGMEIPTSDVRDRRRFLELLWKETFAEWKVDGFDPDAFEIVRS